MLSRRARGFFRFGHIIHASQRARIPHRVFRLQRGDGVAPPVDVASYRVGDADAADQQRGKADERQKLGEVIDIALHNVRINGDTEAPAHLKHGAYVRLSIQDQGQSM